MKNLTIVLSIVAAFTACTSQSDNLKEAQKAETIVSLRIQYLGEPEPQIAYGYFYSSLAWRLGADQAKQLPDTIRLFLVGETYTHLMQESELNPIIATFQNRGVQDDGYKHTINGFVDDSLQVWEVLEMRRK